MLFEEHFVARLASYFQFILSANLFSTDRIVAENQRHDAGFQACQKVKSQHINAPRRGRKSILQPPKTRVASIRRSSDQKE